jgi:hypothetical protein
MLQATGIVGQKGTETIAPVPPNGTIDAGSVKYTMDVTGVVTISPAPDGLSAVITAVGPGVVNINVQATSLGNPISGDTIQATISPVPPPPATSLQVTFSGFA